MDLGWIETLIDLYNKTKDTPLGKFFPVIVVAAAAYCIHKWVVTPLWKMLCVLISNIQKKWFAKKYFHENLSFMNSDDVYRSIRHYVPTRYTDYDPANKDEPVPEYLGVGKGLEPLLISHFLKYEFDQKHGGKYHLCLGDCGIGKTTFLINLYYETLRKKKNYHCTFVSMQDSKCIDTIKKIDVPQRTILLLDALDENGRAVTDFHQFMTELEEASRHFYRVVITSRTNFFESGQKERLFGSRASSSTNSKIIEAKKYYIAPFTDEDIQRYLKRRYRAKKYRQAWGLMEANKNLSVRPMLLRYMDELLADKMDFKYDFQLYEYLFTRWIQRESGSLSEELGKGLYEECVLLAKAIYYQWCKTGVIGIFPKEVEEHGVIPGLSQIQFKGHALLNRTSAGMYKFAHKSFWEYLLAKISLNDVYFADDLLIRNFDQAEAFLEEMIDSGEFYSPEAKLGTACYYLKYKKPEDAEMPLGDVLEMEVSEELKLLAQVLLIKSYQRQMKEASAERQILALHGRLKHIGITENLVPLLTKFGSVLAGYSSRRKLRIGQEFLKNIIQYCEDNHLVGYNLLTCYERYCHCALNPFRAEKAVARMKSIVSQHKEDQFADFLFTQAGIWGTEYEDADSLLRDDRLVTKYEKFCDSYEMIQNHCRLACSMVAVCFDTRDGDFSSHIQSTKKLLKKAEELIFEIYGVSTDQINNPYTALFYVWCIRYYDVIPMQFLPDSKNEKKKHTQEFLRHCEDNRLKNEIQTQCCEILDYAAECVAEDVERGLRFQQMRLDKARSIQCRNEEISALWDCYVLHDRNGSTEAGQRCLRDAYDTACKDEDFKETVSYCELQQVVLDFYEGPIDKEMIYRNLYQAAPMIFGKAKQRKRIYHSLRIFAYQHNDSKAMEFAKEVLLCDFCSEELRELYRAYDSFSDDQNFLGTLENVLNTLPEITQKHEDSVKEFLEKQFIRKNKQGKWEVITHSKDFQEQVRSVVKHVKEEKEKARFEKSLGNFRNSVA